MIENSTFCSTSYRILEKSEDPRIIQASSKENWTFFKFHKSSVRVQNSIWFLSKLDHALEFNQAI